MTSTRKITKVVGGVAYWTKNPRICRDGTKILALVRGELFDGDHFLVELPDGTRTIVRRGKAEEKSDR